MDAMSEIGPEEQWLINILDLTAGMNLKPSPASKKAGLASSYLAGAQLRKRVGPEGKEKLAELVGKNVGEIYLCHLSKATVKPGPEQVPQTSTGGQANMELVLSELIKIRNEVEKLAKRMDVFEQRPFPKSRVQ